MPASRMMSRLSVRKPQPGRRSSAQRDHGQAASTHFDRHSSHAGTSDSVMMPVYARHAGR
jgi:hypothetical protein